VYPASSLHRVAPVTRGTRVASFFWAQSMVRDDAQRSLLFDLDRSIQSLNQQHATHPALVELTGVYHNLLRMWAQI
jgi:PKHD-type hydroxylase